MEGDGGEQQGAAGRYGPLLRRALVCAHRGVEPLLQRGQRAVGPLLRVRVWVRVRLTLGYPSADRPSP